MLYDRQVEHYIARAHELRAQYFAGLIRQAWAGIKRLARRIVPRPAHPVTRAH